MEYGPVAVETIGWVENRYWVALARTSLDPPVSCSEGFLPLAAQKLEFLDAVISYLANVLTVSTGHEFHALSVSPVVGVLGDVEELAPLSNVDLEIPPFRATLRVDDPIDLKQMTGSALADRPDGLALLAESVAHKNDLGRYGQLLRVLERGFGRGIGKFDGALQEFLRHEATRHLFEPDEIQHWVSSRPRIMHADRLNRPVWLRHDAAMTIDRLQEAAVDVLFNKRKWNSPDSERRSVHVPRRGTLNRSTGMFLTAGLELRTWVRTFDPFGSLPLFLKGGIENAVPFGLWAMPDGESTRLLFSGNERPVDSERFHFDAVRVEPANVASGIMLVYRLDDDSVRVPPSEAPGAVDG